MIRPLYLDTSVVVALYVPERLSARAQELYDSALRLALSDLVVVEFFSALSLRLRTGDLQRSAVDLVADAFLGHLRDGVYTELHLNQGHYSQAREYIARFDLPLKAPDALHLAVSAAEDLTLVTADRQLARNAATLGIGAELLAE